MTSKRKQGDSSLTIGMLAIAAAFVTFVGAFAFYVHAEKQIDQANERRFIAMQLVVELRRSSDDLARLAREYVITGSAVSRRRHQDILAIRDGMLSRPDPSHDASGPSYNNDLVVLSGAGRAVGLLDLVREVGFTPDEIALMVQAKSDSDALADIEQDAMKQVTMRRSAPDASRIEAMGILGDDRYIQRQTAILANLERVESMVNRRTTEEVGRLVFQATVMRLVLIALGALQLVLLYLIYRRVHAILGCSPKELQSVIQEIGAGNFTRNDSIATPAQDSVLDWLIQANHKLAGLEMRQFESIVNSTDDAIISESLAGIISSWNPAAERMFGYSSAETIGKPLEILLPPERSQEEVHLLEQIARGQRIAHFETVRRRKDGSLIDVAVTMSPVMDERRQVIGASKIVRDISQRKRDEQDLAKTTRALRTLSACSAAMIQTADEKQLLETLCRIIVETGRYRMAWVGEAQQSADRLIKPIASFGTGTDYLSTVVITWADDQWGRGPTGTAVRTGQIQVNQNYATNPAVAPWRPWAIERGFQASIALPIAVSSGAKLVLTIYASESDAFDPPELRLLEELAGNLAYGIAGIRNRNEKDLFADQIRKLSLAVEQSPESIAITDLDGSIEYVNEAFLRNTGYAREELIGRNPRILQSGRTERATYDRMWQTLLAGRVWQGELHNRRKDGSEFTEFAILSPIRDASGAVTHYLGVKQDITARKQAEERIHHLAFFESLTNLPNRRYLIDRLRDAIAVCSQRGRLGAIFYLDLDNFKSINDTLGHVMGDQLLRQVASRLVEVAGPDNVVAHLGGDDFLVLSPDLGEAREAASQRAQAFGQRIFGLFRRPFNLGRSERMVSPSMGIALFGLRDDTVEEVLKQVDLAMYEAKNAGRNTLRFFDANMQARMEADTTLESELRAALENHEFRLYYQIQVDGAGKAVGAEALLRWQHPQRGLLAPGAFIEIAERSGLIVPIGEWVLDAACRTLASWKADPRLGALTVGVNVSARQFSQANFIDRCLAIFALTGADPHRIKLEPTETLLHEDIEDTVHKMERLRNVGVRFALDDFGTGYSSLAYLRRLPLDQLKIDQSFVHDLPGDSNAGVIARTIIVLGQSLGLSVIAEGVEEQAQRDFLVESGCQQFQGYLFGKPMPQDVFESSVISRLP